MCGPLWTRGICGATGTQIVALTQSDSSCAQQTRILPLKRIPISAHSPSSLAQVAKEVWVAARVGVQQRPPPRQLQEIWPRGLSSTSGSSRSPRPAWAWEAGAWHPPVRSSTSAAATPPWPPPTRPSPPVWAPPLEPSVRPLSRPTRALVKITKQLCRCPIESTSPLRLYTSTEISFGVWEPRLVHDLIIWSYFHFLDWESSFSILGCSIDNADC